MLTPRCNRIKIVAGFFLLLTASALVRSDDWSLRATIQVKQQVPAPNCSPCTVTEHQTWLTEMRRDPILGAMIGLQRMFPRRMRAEVHDRRTR
jgi:hypothetical protein